jgi:hypothetical protein
MGRHAGRFAGRTVHRRPSGPAWRLAKSRHDDGAWSIIGLSVFSIVEKGRGRWIARAGPWQPKGVAGNGNRLGAGPLPMGPRIPRSSRCKKHGLGLRSARLERSRPPDQAKQSSFDFSGKASWVRLDGPLPKNAPSGTPRSKAWPDGGRSGAHIGSFRRKCSLLCCAETGVCSRILTPS